MTARDHLRPVRWIGPPPDGDTLDDRLAHLRWRRSRVGRYAWRRDRGLLTIGEVIRRGAAKKNPA
jgi:hypothetical protein